ncbi:MAG: ATP-binding protein, partial [Planctomycetaceae bacterium]|nr:ATP-binding protein [Planctomycetaceae bacterium]
MSKKQHSSPGGGDAEAAAIKQSIDAIRVATPFAESLDWFGNPDAFGTSGKKSCDFATEAIRSRLLGGQQDVQAELKCLLAVDASLRLVNGYASLDYKHLCDVLKVVASIKQYIGDRSLKRPRNFMMIAAPGSGKSHLVESIAKSVGDSDVGVATFNMATMESKRDLVGVIDACRNITVEGKTPLVFLDEFDSRPENIPLLLPLLWDGTLDFENRQLKVGRCVFVLAGSKDEIRKKVSMIKHCQRPETAEASEDKMVDLLSRISGSNIHIPPFPIPDPQVPKPDPDVLDSQLFKCDKVVISIALLRNRFGVLNSQTHRGVELIFAKATAGVPMVVATSLGT